MPVALVTGASRGIGRAIAERLAAEGYDLCLVGRSVEALERTAQEVTAAGRRALVIREDLTSPEAPGTIAEVLSRELGRLDILVNNAGAASSGPLGTYTTDEWDRVMNLNARAPFFLTQALLPMLKQAGPGYLINICSVVSRKGYPNQALYTASKHALLGFTKALAREVGSAEVRVHAVLPGGVATDMIRDVRPDIDAHELISPHEIADLVAILVRMKGNAVVDEIEVRRRSKPAWD